MTITVAPEFGVPYYLSGPDGTVAAFNDPTSPNYVGVLTNMDGLDSPEVRESGETLVAFDGGVQGPNYYGRRPIIIEGLVYGHTSAAERQAKLAKIMRACDSMRMDSVLSWQPSGTGIFVYVRVRRQQPLKITGGWNKTFQISLVAADPRIYGLDILSFDSPGGPAPINCNIVHDGSTVTYPAYRLFGPARQPFILNGALGTTLSFDTVIAPKEYLEVDTMNRTVTRGTRAHGLRTNFFPNPSFENASGELFTIPPGDGFGGSAPANYTRTTVNKSTLPSALQAGVQGNNVLRMTRTGAATDTLSLEKSDAFQDISPGALYDIPLSNSETITARFSYASAATTTSALPKITFSWYDNTNTFTGSVNSIGPQAPIPTAWRSMRFAATPPSGTAKVRVSIAINPNHGTNTVYYFDQIVFERSAYSEEPGGTTTLPQDYYFDGNTPTPDTGFQAAWSGTAHNSISSSYPLGVLSGGALVSNYQTLIFGTSQWDGLFPGTNAIAYASSSGGFGAGAYLSVLWRNAWM